MPTVPDIHRRGTRAQQATVASPPLTVGTLYFVTDEGQTERWNGSTWEVYSGAGTGVTPPPTPGTTPTTFLVSGGQVVWESAYTFRVSAASYYINGTPYTSAEATVTLGAAHATLDRIDVIALDTLGAVVATAGTASATPSEPSVDPAQYLKLAIVSVPHATVAPPDVETVLIYAEDVGPPTEWAWTSSGASIVVNSTSTPHVGTKCIEGTNVVAGVYAQGTAAAPLDPTDYDQLVLFLRSKAAWNSSRGLLVTLRLGAVLVGASVQIRRSGTFGFDSTITSDYQLVAIPIVAFAVPQGVSIDGVRVEDFGGAIGFFLDDISLQVGATSGGGSSGLSQEQADARYAPLVHAPRHSAGGADPVTVTALAGFPGGTTTYLRADGTFAAAGGGAPAAHKTTHENGGTDEISVAGLSGLLADQQSPLGHHVSHETGGTDAITALDAGVITSGTIAAARLPTRAGVIGLNLDGGGSAITTGTKGFVQIPFACTITAWTILSTDSAATSGSIVFDVWKDTYANYPPVVGDSITASAKPTLSAASKATSSTLTGWTTAIAAGDVLGFKVDSVSTVTKIALTLTVNA